MNGEGGSDLFECVAVKGQRHTRETCDRNNVFGTMQKSVLTKIRIKKEQKKKMKLFESPRKVNDATSEGEQKAAFVYESQ